MHQIAQLSDLMQDIGDICAHFLNVSRRCLHVNPLKTSPECILAGVYG